MRIKDLLDPNHNLAGYSNEALNKAADDLLAVLPSVSQASKEQFEAALGRLVGERSRRTWAAGHSGDLLSISL